MTTALAFLLDLPRNRAMVRLLIAVNLFGTGYGFWWYHGQLRETPPLYWPLVPDSPGSTLLFTLFLLAVDRGRRLPLLESLAYASSIKYGLWTPAVWAYYWSAGGGVTFESVHLSLSHLGMALEAAIFGRFYRPVRPWPLAALAWLVFNDYMDYVRGFHPTLPVPEAVTLIGTIAVILSVSSCIVIWIWGRGAPGRDTTIRKE